MPSVSSLLDGGVVVVVGWQLNLASLQLQAPSQPLFGAGAQIDLEVDGDLVGPGIFLQPPGEGGLGLATGTQVPFAADPRRMDVRDDGPVGPAGNPIPLPGAGLMAAAGLAALAGTSRRRRL